MSSKLSLGLCFLPNHQNDLAVQGDGASLTNEIVRLASELQAAKIELAGQKVRNSSGSWPGGVHCAPVLGPSRRPICRLQCFFLMCDGIRCKIADQSWWQ